MDINEFMSHYIDNELYHHGIKFQKWGVRRFQNNDGSLTPEGRIRYGSGNKKGSKPSTSSSESSKPKTKSVSEMTDQELQAAINRKRLENEYARFTPKQVSKGRKFANAVMKDVVIPAAKSAGKAYVEQQLKKALGVADDKKKKKNNSSGSSSS